MDNGELVGWTGRRKKKDDLFSHTQTHTHLILFLFIFQLPSSGSDCWFVGWMVGWLLGWAFVFREGRSSSINHHVRLVICHFFLSLLTYLLLT